MGNRARKEGEKRAKDWMQLLLPAPISTLIISAVLLFFTGVREAGLVDIIAFPINAAMIAFTLWHAWGAAMDSSKESRKKSWNSVVGQIAAGCGAFLVALLTQFGWLLILAMVADHAVALYGAIAPLLGAMQHASGDSSSGAEQDGAAPASRSQKRSGRGSRKKRQ